MIKAISFDVDGTLLDYDKAMRAALSKVKGRILDIAGPDVDCPSIDQMITIRNRVTALHLDEWPIERIREEGFVCILGNAGVQDRALARSLSLDYARMRKALIRPYDDVSDCLASLGANYRLGLISNGNSHFVPGLTVRFAFELYAHECGVAKPDSAVFGLACSLAQCEPGELLHVGDSLTDDVRGARRAGAISVWINRCHVHPVSAVRPDYEIAGLDELPATVERHCRD